MNLKIKLWRNNNIVCMQVLEQSLNGYVFKTGKIKTEEHCNNISKSITKLQGRPVLQYDIAGNFIKEWESVTYMTTQLGFSGPCISKCCNGKQKASRGFKWSYEKVDKLI